MKSIVVSLEPTLETAADQARADATKAWAQLLSEKLSSDLLAVTVFETSDNLLALDASSRIYTQLLSQSGFKNKAKKVAEKLRGKLKARSQALFGSPKVELTKISQSKKYQMMIMGTHGRKGISRMFLGSVAEEVVRRSQIPIFVLGPNAQKKSQVPSGGEKLRVLVATDLGAGSAAAEKFAVDFAKKTGATIVLLHCSFQGKDPMIQIALSTPDGQRAVSELFKGLHKSLALKIRKKQKKITDDGVDCEIVLDERYIFSEKSVAKAIEQKDIDLVVTGTNARNLFGKAYFGSMTRQTILNAPVPVVVVRNS
jgi:nucleotide-binding universal stress UspA family protein